MTTMAPTFQKKERIVSKKLIETLFEKGNSQTLAAYPIRAIFQKTERREDCAPVQILISIPKKRFKHAVDRNRVKRQIRESYRHHKHLLSQVVGQDEQLLIAFVWLFDKHLPSQDVEKKVVNLLQRIAERS